MKSKYQLVAAAACVTGLLLGASAAAQETLEGAKRLYAAAAYSEALAALDRVKAGSAATHRVEVDHYRALCQLAMGRTAAADETISGILSADPFYDVRTTDASPRVKAAFDQVRRRVLPVLVRERYADAKAAFDGRDFRRAAAKFEGVLALLDEPALVQAGPAIDDLRMLANGFLALSNAAPAPEALTRSPAVVTDVPLPEVVATMSAQQLPAHQDSSGARTVYTSSDWNVTAPVPVREALPPWPASVPRSLAKIGILDIVIDERGTVVSAEMRSSVASVYDRLVLSAAKSWRYVPGRRANNPVKFRKRIQIRLNTAAP